MRQAGWILDTAPGLSCAHVPLGSTLLSAQQQKLSEGFLHHLWAHPGLERIAGVTELMKGASTLFSDNLCHPLTAKNAA